MTTIKNVKARQVLDSRGNPTVEVDVILDNECVGTAMVPSGASTGVHEAWEIRDHDEFRYYGKSVYRAVENVHSCIAPALKGKNPLDQRAIDQLLIELDGTPEKKNLGANAILGVSLAVARAAALMEKCPLYEYIAEILLGNTKPVMPLPMVNMISGGLHAGGNLDFQDFLVIPIGSKTYSDAMETVFRMYNSTRKVLSRRGYDVRLVADEGGLAPNLGSNEEALDVLTESIIEAGYSPAVDVAIAIDVASSHFYQEGDGYSLKHENVHYSSNDMIQLLDDWVKKYPILSIEDGLAEDDWKSWQQLTNRLGKSVQLIGDDLFTTSCERLQKGIQQGAANSILIKANQIGTLSETLDAIQLARNNGYRQVISARSGETEDSFIADLAVATSAGQIKIGSITRSERLAKYNRLFRIEEELGARATFYSF